MKPLFSAVSLCLAALLLAACGDTPTDGETGPVVTPLFPDMIGVAGLYQGNAGVTVKDAAGQPLAGAVVEWSVDAGRLDSPTSVTNEWGEARIGWQLGSTPGEQHLVARVADADEVTITSRAEAPVRLELPANPIGMRTGDTTYVIVNAWTASGHREWAHNELLSWEMGDSSVVEVLPDGSLFALASGETAVTIRLGDISARTTVTVDAPWVEMGVSYREYVLPDTVLEPRLFVRDAFWNRVTPPLDSVEWSSDSPAATVDAAGRVTTHHAGTASIVARYYGLADTVIVRVRDPLRVVDASPLDGGPCVYAPDGLRCWNNLSVSPQQLARLHPFGGDLADVRLGRGFGCGLDADGPAVCWGDGEFGQTGRGSPADSTGPAPVAGGRRFTALTAGWNHACGVDVDGRVLCWGRNDVGQLGAASGESCGGVDCSTTPLPVDLGGSRAVQVEAGAESACALLEDGGVTCWGDLERDGVAAAPASLPGSTRFRSIDLGRTHACGLSIGGEAFCWGEGRVGQLGNGELIASDSPVPVAEPGTFASLSVSDDHACALTGDGAAYCWGDNSHGQLGYGTQEERHRDRPTPVLTERRFTTIATDGAISCGVVADGRMFCWGQQYLLGNPGVAPDPGCAMGPYGVFPCVPYPTEPVLAGLPEDGGW